MVRLALYKPHRWYDIGGRLICWWTHSPYSHCELVIGDVGYSSSIRDGGVRAKRIEFDPAHWDFIGLPWAHEFEVKAFFAQTAGAPYGWTDLVLRQVLNKGGDSPGYFCSEWVAAALGLPNPQTFNPGTLGDCCKSRN